MGEIVCYFTQFASGAAAWLTALRMRILKLMRTNPAYAPLMTKAQTLTRF